MAGAHCAPTSFFTAFSDLDRTPLQTRQLKLVSRLSAPSPSRRSDRKNYLRPKLLKTLKKPYTHLLFPDSIPIDTDIPVDSKHEQKESEQDEFRQSEAWSSYAITSAGIVNSSKSMFFKVVPFLVGIFFVYQTIESIWLLSSANYDNQTIDLELLAENKEKSKMDSPLNTLVNSYSGKSGIQKDEIVRVDNSELEKKIAEIQTMARDAREKEGVNLIKNDSYDDDDEDDDAVVNSGIKKEVDNRLVVLTRNLKKNHQKPVSFSGISSKNGNVKDDFYAKMADATLMYKKKHKFERFSSDPTDKPNGFQSSENGSVKRVKSKLIERMDEMLKVEMPSDDLDEENSITSEEYQVDESAVQESKSLSNSSKNLDNEKGTKKHDLLVQETKSMSNPSKNLVSEKASKTQGKRFGKRETQPSAGNAQVKSNVMSRESILNIKENSATKADPWWWSLKYALVLFMRSSSNGETKEGLYTLHGFSSEPYTVALEDRADAMNLCYIVESFRVNIENELSVEILPVSIQELALEVEAANSMMKNVLFVKKGELKLYAGQPLEEIETALRSLI